MAEKPKKILITGVTASGKGRLAFELAKRFNGEIISVDSMKVYKRMDIGTAKPPEERRQEIPHHLIDVVEPSDSFCVDQFLQLFEECEKDILSRNKTAVAVGGTAMYIKALMYGLFEGPGSDENIRNKIKQSIKAEGLHAIHDELKQVDPEAAGRIHPNDAKRIIRALEVYKLTGKPISSFQTQFEREPRKDWLVIGLTRDKETENRRMNKRAKLMFENGLIKEVKSLLAEDKPLSKQAKSAIGYRETIEYLQGKHDLEDTVELVKRNTRRFAKSQRTWFKRFTFVNWIDIQPEETLQDITQKALEIINSSTQA